MTAIATSIPSFWPEQTSTLLCTTASGAVGVALGLVGDTIMMKNEGGSTAFVEFGDVGTVATAGGSVNASNGGSYPLLAGEISTIRVNSPGQGISAFGTTLIGTALVRITRGSGV